MKHLAFMLLKFSQQLQKHWFK